MASLIYWSLILFSNMLDTLSPGLIFTMTDLAIDEDSMVAPCTDSYVNITGTYYIGPCNKNNFTDALGMGESLRNDSEHKMLMLVSCVIIFLVQQVYVYV